MSIRVTCGDCAAEYRLANRYAGKRCKCRECGTRIAVPAAGTAKAKRRKRKKARATVSAGAKPGNVTSKSTTRRLGAQDSDIISERRELRRRMGVPRPVSESLHQLAPMNSGDELERLIPKRRRKTRTKKERGAKVAEPKKGRKRKARSSAEGKSAAQTKTKGKKAKTAEKKTAGKKAKAKTAGKKAKAKTAGKKTAGKARAVLAKGKRTTQKRAVAGRARGRRGSEERAESPTRKPLIAVAAILGVLCLGVGLVVGFFLRDDAPGGNGVAAQIEKIEGLKRHRQWDAAQAAAAKLEKQLEEEGDQQGLHRLYAVSAGVDTMVQVLALEDDLNRLEYLGKFAADSDASVRLGVAWELRSLRMYEEAQAALHGLTDDADPEVREAARQGMVAVGGPLSIPYLIQAIQDTASTGGKLGEVALERALEIGEPEVAPVLVSFLELRPNAPAGALRAALEHLADVGSPEHAAAAKPFLAHEDEGVARAAQNVEDALSS